MNNKLIRYCAKKIRQRTIFRRRQLSDAEYVDHIRKQDLVIRRMRWIWPILMVAVLLTLTRVGRLIQLIGEDLPMDKLILYTGMAFGFSFGLMLNLTCLNAALCLKQWLDAYRGYRTERLMLKYHDIVHPPSE
jgi:hypothetical protein